MSSNKREASDEAQENSAKREKIDDQHLDQENKESSTKEESGDGVAATDSVENGSDKPPTADSNGQQSDAVEKDGQVEDEPEDDCKGAKDDGCGVLMICGGTNWDLTGRRESSKAAKDRKAVGRNLWSPHCYNSMQGIRVRKAISGNAACHSILITEHGKAMSWGRNEKGQLGLADEKRRDVPTLIDSLSEHNVVNAACGRSHTLILTDKGLVFGCGDNKLGQCGIGSAAATVTTPTQISYSGAPLIRVACGGEFSMVVDVRGFLFSFGCPEYGQLGHNSDGKYFVTSNKLSFNCENAPRRVTLFIEKSREGHVVPVENVSIRDVACGANHTVAVDNNKRVFSWGFGGYGRLGHSSPKDEMVPRNLKCFDMVKRGVASVFAGGSYSMAVGESGVLFFWGQSKTSGEATMYPKPVHDLQGWEIRSVGCGLKSIVVAAEESVISWGPSPTYGELGYGENKAKSSTTPLEVKPVAGLHVSFVSCGLGHTLLVARDTSPEDKKRIEKLPVYDP